MDLTSLFGKPQAEAVASDQAYHRDLDGLLFNLLPRAERPFIRTSAFSWCVQKMWLGVLPLDSVHLGLNPSSATAMCPLDKMLTFSKLYFFVFILRR